MKKTTTILILLLCCTMLSKANPEATKIGNIYYIIDADNSTASVTWGGEEYDSYSGTEEYTGSITIPATVTDTENKTYNVTAIGNYAFYSCQSLTSVNIPDCVKDIGSSAFAGCRSLTSVKIPNGVTSIKENTFDACINLTTVSIPESVTSIGDVAFAGCRSLTSVNIPYGVERIEENTFHGCSSLTSVDIPSSVKSIVHDAFFYCTNLITVSIPDGVTKIEYSTFDNCRSLTSVDIPSSVKSIENCAFIDCWSLKEINFQGTTPPSLGDKVFSGIASDAVFIVPDEALESYKTVLGEVNLCNFSNYQTNAISAVKAAMGEDKESPYLNNLVKTEVEAIGAAETYSAIRTARDEALKKISTVIEAFQASKSEILGTKQNGPAVKVTYGGKTVITYNPDTVEYIIVKE